jgi:hypothetical protein
MVRRSLAFLAVIVVSAVSTGCALNVEQVAFKRDAGEPIRSIAVPSVPNPVMTTVHNFGSLGGGIGAAASQSKYEEPLTSLLKEANFDFSKEMRAAIVGRLQQAGYRVVPVEIAREKTGTLLEDYSKVPTAGADAVLDLATGAFFGYANVDMLDNKYRPYIVFNARLVSSKTKQPLYGERMLYGWTNMFLTATQLKAPEKYFYADADMVIANKKNTTDGLRAGIDTIADHLVAQLKP